jgi:L-ascorbate metabolism protein UlaG (beta-lactamase superfamily)
LHVDDTSMTREQHAPSIVRLSRRTLLVGAAAALSTPALAGQPKRSLHPSMARYAPLLLPPATGDIPDGGLRARFMGVSTILFEAPSGKLLVDGFFSRPGLLRGLFSRVEPQQARIDEGLRLAQADKLSGVLVAHAHHDHAMDTADVAQAKGGVIVGSRSMANLARARGFTGEIHEVRDRQKLKLDAFEIEAIASPHSDPNLFPGTIAADLPRKVRLRGYKDDQNFSYLVKHGQHRILVQASAGVRKGGLTGIEADVVFLGVGSLDPKEFGTYWRQAVMNAGAQLVIPIHWDNFFQPQDEGLRAMPWPLDHVRRNLNLVIDQAKMDGVAIGFMPLFNPVDMPLRRKGSGVRAR